MTRYTVRYTTRTRGHRPGLWALIAWPLYEILRLMWLVAKIITLTAVTAVAWVVGWLEERRSEPTPVSAAKPYPEYRGSTR
jgi:hypothetical protein